MFKLFSLPFALSILVGCSPKDSSDSGSAEIEDTRVPEQEGRWAVTDGSWSDDQCNGPMSMQTPTSYELSAARPGTFTVELFIDVEEAVDGPVDCSATDGESAYVCDAFTSGWDIVGYDASVSLTGVIDLIFSGETTAAGSVDMVMECDGSGCEGAGESIGITVPCTTTFNFLGTYTPE